MTRLFIGGIATETNSFSPIPTTMSDFEAGGVFYGTATQSEPLHFTAPLHVWRKQAEAEGIEVVEGLMAAAQPGGTTLTHVWEEWRDRLLADVRRAAPLDMVLLNLHGAMIAADEFDCEGELLAGIRDICPDAVIGCELDLHCHLTRKMMQAADLIVPYKEYPHTDTVERAEDLWALALRTQRGEIYPVGATSDCNMLSVWHTTRKPMSDFVARMSALEDTGEALAVSFCHGFALGDMPELGSRTLVYTDGNAEAAQALADTLATEVWDMRNETRTPMMNEAEAVAAAQAAPRGPVIIADVADNPGVGAGADSTYLISALIDADAKGAVVGLLFDPMAVSTCVGAGKGANLNLRIGGKFSARSGPPLDLDVTVRAVVDDLPQTTVAGQKMSCGRAAVVETDGGIRIVLIERRVQTFHPDAFTQLGVDLKDVPIVVVKSTQHFHAGFAPVAGEILYARSPTAVQFEGPENPYRHRDGNYWPLTENPARG
ncbi:M81 family metallopeptidase [Arenibacterium halophilum]|uniref:Microcystinase C n=1 Tax=Arenibacterium halophilum TaxID=2583821 RepID=A0ABY2WZE5_9RHOB|nr:M81 family metallopeptidase [Arenibacterium halophilum]TMV08320.1 M81 family metallopeptidase [Arenibacterium halophilum]